MPLVGQVYGTERATLIQGDCLEVLRDLPDASVDAVVTDPPWGVGFHFGDVRDAPKDPTDYWAWLRPRYRECLRVLKTGGAVAVWQSHTHFRYLWNWFGEDIHIYAACKSFSQLLRNATVNRAYDPVVLFHKSGGVPLRPSRPARNKDFFVANTGGTKSLLNGKGHPCPRPLDQVCEIVANFTTETGTVLDPFSGSGTTGVACLQTGRNFIGIEISEEYCRIAKERLAKAELACVKQKET